MRFTQKNHIEKPEKATFKNPTIKRRFIMAPADAVVWFEFNFDSVHVVDVEIERPQVWHDTVANLRDLGFTQATDSRWTYGGGRGDDLSIEVDFEAGFSARVRVSLYVDSPEGMDLIYDETETLNVDEVAALAIATIEGDSPALMDADDIAARAFEYATLARRNGHFDCEPSESALADAKNFMVPADVKRFKACYAHMMRALAAVD